MKTMGGFLAVEEANSHTKTKGLRVVRRLTP